MITALLVVIALAQTIQLAMHVRRELRNRRLQREFGKQLESSRELMERVDRLSKPLPSTLPSSLASEIRELPVRDVDELPDVKRKEPH